MNNHISGKDSLVVAVLMKLDELKDKLELYHSAYTDDRYKRIGFEWVDNVAEVRDSVLSESLDFQISDAIEKRNIEHLDIAVEKFGVEPFDASVKPSSNEYEIIYAIIDDKDSDINTKLPFFSKVNLMLTAQELERMHFKYSVCLIKREE